MRNPTVFGIFQLTRLVRGVTGYSPRGGDLFLEFQLTRLVRGVTEIEEAGTYDL